MLAQWLLGAALFRAAACFEVVRVELSTPGAGAECAGDIPALESLTAFAHAHRIPIVASADNHDATDAEISDARDWKTTVPPPCIRGTAGQLKIAETALLDPLVIGPEPAGRLPSRGCCATAPAPSCSW